MKPMLIKPLLGTRLGGRNNANLISLRLPAPRSHISETGVSAYTLWMRKVKLRTVNRSTGRLACWWQSQDSNPGLLTFCSDSFHTHPGPTLHARPLSAKEKTFAMFCVLQGKPKEFPTTRCWHFKYWFMDFFGKNAPRALSPLVK